MWKVGYPNIFSGNVFLWFVVHAPTIIKLGTDLDIELDVLRTVVTKHFVTMLLLSNYDAITGIYADVQAS